MPIKKTKSFSFKIIMGIVVIFAFATISALVIGFLLQVQTQRKHIVEEKRSMVKIVAESIESSYKKGIWPFSILYELQKSPDVLFWWVVRSDGKVELANDPEMWGKRIESPWLGARSQLIKNGIDYKTGEDIKVIIYPLELKSGQYYNFFLGISMSPIRLFSLSSIAWGFFVYILIVSILFAVSVKLASKVLKPIKKLLSGVRSIAKGDFDTRLTIKTGDEFEELGKAFNKMLKAVKKARAHVDLKVENQTKEIERNYQELEKQRKAIMNILEDVEEEKKTAQREKDKLKAILQGIGDAVFVIDKEYRLVLFNKVAEDISGFSAEDVLGEKYDQVLRFVYEKDQKTNNDFVDKAMETGETQFMTNHTLLINKKGEKIPVADSSAPLKDKNGQVAGCVVVFRDVTEERKVDRMKSEFVSVASHQLRTPLTSIKLFIELLADGEAGELTAQQKDYIEDVSESTERMISLVNELLNVSRLESGRMKVEPQKIRFEDFIQKIIDDSGVLSEDKNCRIDFEKPQKKLSKISLDPVLMRQVIHNLLTNAIYYSPKDRCKIKVKLQKKKNDYLLSVKDKGIGIPKKEQDRIFDKFFRSDKAQKARPEGSGLGLYINKMIVEEAGGEIWFESEGRGKGTTFYVKLPQKGMSRKKGEKGIAKS